MANKANKPEVNTDVDNSVETSIDDETLTEIADLMKQQKEVKKYYEDKIEYVDMEKIKVVKPDIVKQQETLYTMFNSKPSFQVVCSQSGYAAKIIPMIYRDIIAITNSNLSAYEHKKELYRIIYSKINGYSVDNWRPSFEEWLEITSLGDYETLLYGLYCATFQDKSVIRYECPYCGKVNITTINNKQLVRVNDKAEMLEITNRIAKEADTVDKIKEFSSVSDLKKNEISVKLPNSKIIFTIKIPTLQKTLDILKKFNSAELAAKSLDAQNALLATKAVAIPDIHDPNEYSYIEDIGDIFVLIDNLDIDDFTVLKKVINKILDEKHISYYAEKQTCSACEKEIDQIPLDIEALLFFQISERQLS